MPILGGGTAGGPCRQPTSFWEAPVSIGVCCPLQNYYPVCVFEGLKGLGSWWEQEGGMEHHFRPTRSDTSPHAVAEAVGQFGKETERGATVDCMLEEDKPGHCRGVSTIRVKKLLLSRIIYFLNVFGWFPDCGVSG